MDTRGETDLREKRWQEHYFRKAVNDHSVRQFHCYSSFFFAEDRFGELFSELFRPAPALNRDSPKHRGCSAGIISPSSARFLELLGDFDEPRRERIPLHSGERDRLYGRLHQLKSEKYGACPKTGA